MLLEGYLAKIKTYPQDEIHIVVTRTAHSVLAPSLELLHDWKSGKIDWGEYTRRLVKEMLYDSKAAKELLRIQKLSETEDVRLICYERYPPCHRFILLALIEALKTIEHTVELKMKEWIVL